MGGTTRFLYQVSYLFNVLYTALDSAADGNREAILFVLRPALFRFTAFLAVVSKNRLELCGEFGDHLRCGAGDYHGDAGGVECEKLT